jgi:hypothetical protein
VTAVLAAVWSWTFCSVTVARGAVAASAEAESCAAPPWDFSFLSSILDSVVEELEILKFPEISETLCLSDAGTLKPVGTFAMTSA